MSNRNKEYQPTLFDAELASGDGHADVAEVQDPEAEYRAGFKQVKRVGWVPEGWSTAQVGDLIDDISAGYSARSIDRSISDGEVGVLKVSAVSYGKFLPEEHKVVLPEEYDNVKVSPRVGCILISRSNTDKLVGASVFVDTDYPDLFLPDTLWQITAKDKVSGKWLNYALASDRMRFNIQGAAMGTSGSMKKLSMKRLRRLKVAVPPSSEQGKIASLLGAWDEALAQFDALIAAKEERLKGLAQRLLKGEVRLPKYAGEPWQEKRIGSLLKPVKRPVDWDDNAEYDLVSIKRGSQGMVFRESIHGRDIKTKNLNVLREGDFVISRMQVVHGATALVTEEFDGMHASNSYMILVPGKEDAVDTAFYAWLSKLPYMYHVAFLASYGVHIEKMTFNPKLYFKTKIRVPRTVEEQRAIVSILDTAEAEIGLLREERAVFARQKKGLMQLLLTGEVRVVPNEGDQ